MLNLTIADRILSILISITVRVLSLMHVPFVTQLCVFVRAWARPHGHHLGPCPRDPSGNGKA